MADDAEVRIRLVVGSNDEQVAENVKKNTGKIAAAFNKAGSMIKSGFGSAIKTVGSAAKAGFHMMAHEAMKLGKEAFTAPIEAFMESEKQVKELAATFALLDAGTLTFQQMKIFAGQTKDELEGLGMAIGVTDDELVAVFNNVIERGGKSVDEAKELTEQMAYAGRAIPGGALAISEAFESIEMGMVKAKNPIVGMISATGMLKGNAKQVAEQMKKMTSEEQIKLAEKAVAKMGDKMKDVPMTIGESLTSLKVMAGNLLEGMGEPMTASLSKAVLTIRGKFFEDTGEATELTNQLMEGAKAVGTALSGIVDVLGPFGTSFIDGLTEFSGQFRFIWSEVWGEGDGMMSQLKDVAVFAGRTLGAYVKGTAILIGGIVRVLQGAIKEIVDLIGWVVRMTGKITGSKGIESAGMATQSFAHKAEVGDIAKKASMTGGGSKEDLTAQMSYIAEMSGDASVMKQLEDGLQKRADMQARINQAESIAADRTGQGAEQYILAFGAASAAHDEAAMKNIASFLKHNGTMADAIGRLGPDIIEGGVEGFAKSLDELGNKAMANIVRAGQKQQMPGDKGPKVNQYFSGAININQDFKDEDPDRIVEAFKDELANAGTNRLQAAGASFLGF